MFKIRTADRIKRIKNKFYIQQLTAFYSNYFLLYNRKITSSLNMHIWHSFENTATNFDFRLYMILFIEKQCGWMRALAHLHVRMTIYEEL